MREQQQIRISLEEFFGNGSYGPLSIVYCSKEKKDSRTILNRIVEDLRDKLVKTVPSYPSSNRRYMEKWLTALENDSPDYMKWQKYSLSTGDFYMHQLIIPHPTIDGYGTKQIKDIGRICNDLFNTGIYPMVSSDILRDEIYSLAEIKLFLNKEIFCCSSGGEIIDEYLRKLNVNDFLSFSYEIDTSKIYNNGSIVKANLITYQTFEECIKSISNRTVNIGVYALTYGNISFGGFKSGSIEMNGAYIFKRTPHFKIETSGNILILYDGIKARQDLEPLLHISRRPMTIIANQFDTPFINSMGQEIGSNETMLYLTFMDPQNIMTRRQDLMMRNGNLHTSIQYKVNNKKRFSMTELGYANNGSNRYKHSYIIPFGPKSKIAIETVKKFVMGEGGTGLCSQYLDTIYPQQENIPDSLSEWFTRCTKLTKRNNDNVICAYRRMKDQLEKEYKEIGAYLDYYNFANCAPVPSLKIDKSMLKRYSKSLHIDLHNYKINIINNKNIKEPINQTRASVTIVQKTRKGRLFTDDVLLDVFYNNKDNSIDLGTKKLKGVIYDKIKNR